MPNYTFPNKQPVILPSERHERWRTTAAVGTAITLIGLLAVRTPHHNPFDVTCTGITTIRHDHGNYALTPKIAGTLPGEGYVALWADTPHGTDTILELKDMQAKYPPELAHRAGRVVFSIIYNADTTLLPGSTALPKDTEVAACPAVDIK